VNPDKWKPARRWLRNVRGKASDYISPFGIKRGQPVVLCLRVSIRDNVRNLKYQESNLRRIVKLHGGIVVGVIRFQGSGYLPWDWIPHAAYIAKKANAVLLAESTDRFIRNRHYRPKSKIKQRLQATDEELNELVCCADGVPLMTHLHPDTHWKKVRSYQTIRGHRGKNRTGGRLRSKRPGWKKRRKDELKGRAQRFYKSGMSIRDVAKRLRTPPSTISDWLRG
jgi:hypothetical protein